MWSLVMAVAPLGCGRIGFDGLGGDGAPGDDTSSISLELLAGDIGGLGNVDGTGGVARFDSPRGVAVDGAGNVYVADQANQTIRKLTPGGAVTTLAGSAGVSGSADGTGAAARFDAPGGVAVDGAGNVYVADQANHTIRKITSGGVVTTLAGAAGLAGSTDGMAASARFSSPSGVAVDSAGNLYVADQANHTIRKITPDGVVTTLAGTAGMEGFADGTGAAARFTNPNSVAVDSKGNVYVIGTIDNLRKITPGGVVSTLNGSVFSGGVAADAAGNIYYSAYFGIYKLSPAGAMATLIGNSDGGSADGTAATAGFHNPTGVAVDDAGNLYVADTGNDTIRKITASGVVTTLAGTAGVYGSADGTGRDARFLAPTGVATDDAGNVYVADTGNENIRKVTPDGVVTTLAGTTTGMYGSADGTGPDAQFYSPTGVAVDATGAIYVADHYNNIIRKVTPGGVVTTLAGTKGMFSEDGSAPATGYDLPTGVTVDRAGTVYIADERSHTIRKVTPDGVVTTLAGTAGVSGHADGVGPAAQFNSPTSVTVDEGGNVYVADKLNHTIRKITAAGMVTTLAGTAGMPGGADGTGAAARFNAPTGVVVDSSGNVYVADSLNRTIRKMTPDGVVTTAAGTPGVAGILLGAAPRFARPQGLAITGDSIVVTDLNAVLLVRHGVK